MILLDGTVVNPLVAFIAGLVSFLAPCVLAILPAQATILSDRRHRVFINALIFVFGFMLVFTLLGVGVNSLGRLLGSYRDLVQVIGGAFLIFLGLSVLGIWRVPIFYRSFGIRLDEKVKRLGGLWAFLVGVTFGFAWSPCIGPVLAVILLWSSQQETLTRGVIMMFFYGLGLAVPFLILSFFLDSLKRLLLKSGKFDQWLQGFLGVIIIAVGILLITNRVGLLISWVLSLQ